MSSLASSPAVRRLLATAVVARLPEGMLGIGLMVHTQRLTGSFALAGLVTGVYALAAGSFAGGLVFARLGRARSTAAPLLLLFALTVGHLLLIPAAGAVALLGAVLFIAGGAIAPTGATVSAMVEDAAPAGAITEAFAWLAGAMAVGGAGGAAAAGVVVDTTGATAAFALAAAAGAVATLIAIARQRAAERDPRTFRLGDDASRGAPCRSVS
jgi:predicted MFS family arabinose efflux permease